MKILNKLTLIFILAVLCTACQRDEVMFPDIVVTTAQDTYAVNDSIEFKFTGSSDMVTFYSGEKGKSYQHRNRVELEGGELMVNMETQVLYGIQTDNLKLLVSTDFQGKYTKEGVASATWIDISDRFVWGSAAGGAVGTRTPSGNASITDLLKSGKPVYFAFKYVGKASTNGVTPQQRTWRIYEFNVLNKFSETEIVPVTNRAGAAWNSVSIDNEGGKGVWFFTNATMIYYNPESNLLDVEKWSISKRFDPNKVAPDKGVSIKKYPDGDMLSYKYAFSEPGEYEVTFVFVNGNYKGAKEKVKTIKVTIK